MAFDHIHFDDQTQYGRSLRRFLQMAEDSDDLFADVRDCMIQMRTGDGSQDVHYAEVTARYGFTDDVKAREAFNELDSAYQISVNANAARDQLYAKLRG